MTIYIPQFVLGIIATLAVEVGICFLVGLLSSMKGKSNKTQSVNEETNPVIKGEVGEREV